MCDKNVISVHLFQKITVNYIKLHYIQGIANYMLNCMQFYFRGFTAQKDFGAIYNKNETQFSILSPKSNH